MKASQIKVVSRENHLPGFNYADAMRRKNEARWMDRARVRAGRLSPRAAQKRASLFDGIQSRVICYGQGAAI